MNGTVIIRAPMHLVQIHRSQLSYIAYENGAIGWKHLGDSHELTFDFDLKERVIRDDEEVAAYDLVAAEVFRTIVEHAQDVTWTWLDGEWKVYYAPYEMNVKPRNFDLHEDMVGYGSLGR